MQNEKAIGLISLYVAENYGLRLLSALLRKNGYRVVEIYLKDWKNNLLEWPSELEIKNLIGILKQYNVSLAGVSVRASGFMDIAKLITSEIREKLKLPVIWGGMHPTSMPDECIEVVDFISIGESEEAFLEFINKFFNNENLRNIPNIWVNEDGIIFKNPPRPLIIDLDSVAFRNFTSPDKFFINKKSLLKGDPCLNDRIYLITASRGCLYKNCSFCIISLLEKLYENHGGYKYRYRSVENVISELKQAKKIFRRIKRVRFDDELFVADKEWVKKFSKRYKEDIALPFDILLHPQFVNKDNLVLLQKAGLDAVIMGVQNTERINKVLYNRNQTNTQVFLAGGIIRSLKLKTCYQLIVDDPVSNSQDKKELFDLIFSLPRPFELYLFSLTIYPNTPLAKRMIVNKQLKYEEQIQAAKRIFFQYRVDLNFKRSKEDIFWLSLLVLLSKRFIPKNILQFISKSEYFKKYPFLIRWTAELANVSKMFFVFLNLLFKDEIDLRTIRRWFNVKSVITQ